jgi:hypothetical protein
MLVHQSRAVSKTVWWNILEDGSNYAAVRDGEPPTWIRRLSSRRDMRASSRLRDHTESRGHTKQLDGLATTEWRPIVLTHRLLP